MPDGTIMVEVVYARPERQELVQLELPAGATAGEAVRRSGLAAQCGESQPADIGIFGEHVDPDRPLEDGDRVEIYRPLIADPKEVRRALARQGRTMGRRRR
ncbi:MAG TPA: RnfH family protein [Arenicellales bacterium]|nr:RnfH family protein [Arenicellales bacterium]